MEGNITSEHKSNNRTTLAVSAVVVVLVAIIGISLVMGTGNGKQSPTPETNTITSKTEPNTNAAVATAPSNTYTLDEVSKHNSKDSCWMVVSGQVYDVTSYTNSHPGGREILKGCGVDATSFYDTRGGEGTHSDTAHKLLENFQIGTLAN